MAPHSSTLAWKISWTEEPGGLPSMGSHSRTRLKRLSSSSSSSSSLIYHCVLWNLVSISGFLLTNEPSFRFMTHTHTHTHAFFTDKFGHILLLLMLSRFSHVWLCNPMDCNPPDSSVHGIVQARVLEWVAIALSGSIWPVSKIRHLFMNVFLHFN